MASFTDGVMAVAITLLVLNIDVPRVGQDELAGELVDLLPTLGAYVLSFALVGRFWVIHHRLFETLDGFDSALMGLNLVFLALIALVPFSTDLVDRYSSAPEASAVFGAILGLAALTHWAMTRHVLGRGFVGHEHREATKPYGSAISLTFAAVFLLSVPAAYLSTVLAQVLWISTIVLRYPLRSVARWTSR